MNKKNYRRENTGYITDIILSGFIDLSVIMFFLYILWCIMFFYRFYIILYKNI